MKLLLKLARSAAVSAISTTVSLVLLGLLVATNATTAGWANVVATLGFSLTLPGLARAR